MKYNGRRGKANVHGCFAAMVKPAAAPLKKGKAGAVLWYLGS